MSFSEPLLLTGDAARFKGGRSYVHGTDLIAFLDNWSAVNLQGYLSKIEFRRPLKNLGAMVTSPVPDAWDLEQTTAVGLFEAPGGKLSFALFATPISVERSDSFDEQELVDGTSCSPDGTAFLRCVSSASIAEHASSAMKALCRTMLPHHERWWFARCRLNQNLPVSFERLELDVKRIMAKTLVTAELRFDGAHVGELVFAGAKA